MPSIFSGPPKLPPQPVIRPPQNTALTAQLQALSRRQGQNMATVPQTGQKGSLLTHGLTGQ